MANVFFFDENCVRNLEKRCKEEKIKWAKSNLQRQYIMKKKPLVSYIEGKVDPHTPEGKDLIKDLENYRELKNLSLPQFLDIMLKSSTREIDSMVEMAKEDGASKRAMR